MDDHRRGRATGCPSLSTRAATDRYGATRIPGGTTIIDHLQGLRREIDRFQAAIGDLDASVPSCPEWRVRDLVHHLGSVHRTFRRVANEALMHRPPAPTPDDRPEADDDRVVCWAEQQGRLLLQALEGLDPSAPRWNFSPGPQVGAFIPRRMHHETTMHRWDLEGAYGPPTPICDDTAMDGLLEYLEVYLPRSGPWNGPPVVVHTVVDGGVSYETVLDPGATATFTAEPARRPDAVVAGDPGSLLLAWWDRMPLVDQLVSGETAAIEEVRRFAYT